VNRADAEAYKLARNRLGAAFASLPLGAYRLSDVLSAVEPTIGMYTSAAADFLLNNVPGLEIVVDTNFDVWVFVHPEVLKRAGCKSEEWDGPRLRLEPRLDVFSPAMREAIVHAFDNGMTGDLLGLDIFDQLEERARRERAS